MTTKKSSILPVTLRKVLSNRLVVTGSIVAAALVMIFAVSTLSAAIPKQNIAGVGQQKSGSDKGRVGQSQDQPIPNSADKKLSKDQDPASQRQTSLASAASTPNSSGNNGDNPASGVSGGNKRVDPKDVLGGRKGSGISSGGCAVGYGRPDQCVPARAPGGGPATCTQVRRMFPNGVGVTGSDQLKLDRNNDKVACSTGDMN